MNRLPELLARHTFIAGQNNWKRPLAIGVISVAFTCTSAWGALSAQSQQRELSEYLAQNAFELEVKDGRLAGPGARWLLQRASKSQFVFVGEDHGIAQIPQFASALWHELTPLGYKHVAVEEGPWVIALADKYVRRSDKKAIQTYKTSVVPNLEYGSDEHFAFLDVLRSTSQGSKIPTVWGLDQEMRIVPLLNRLLTLAPDNGAVRAVNSLLSKTIRSDKEGIGSLGLFYGYRDDILAIRKAFGTRATAEARQLIDAMEISDRLYDNNRRASSELTGYESNREREEMMKDLFLRQYRTAQQSGERIPKVMLWFGEYHGVRGISPTNVVSLGDFLSGLAQYNGRGFLNIAVTCGRNGLRSGTGHDVGSVGKDIPCGADEAEWAQPMLKAAKWKWTLFDLAAIRPALHAGAVKAGPPFSTLVFQYDSLLVIQDTTGMHFSENRPKSGDND
jgi:hypothetical protein